MNKPTIELIPEAFADTSRTAKIRFDAYVEMHDAGYRIIQHSGFLTPEKRDKKPQWFKSHVTLTLEGIKYADPMSIGMAIKQQFFELEQAIKQYEES